MENIDLLIDLAFAMGGALVGGFVAHLLRQPVILGYLVAGILVGPYTPGPTSSLERVQTLANLGVTLLMFALGTEFSLGALRRVRRVAVYGGITQIVLNIALGTALGVALGFPLPAAVLLGGTIAISSSILMLKLLLARDEVESVVGRVALGTGIVQDLAMVALIIILPALSVGVGPELLTTSGFAILKGAGFLVITYVLGTRLVPPLLERIARLGSRELFLLTIVAIAVGTSVLGEVVGISFALGAFLGGLIVSESEYSHHVLEEIIPIRDLFATLFFVAIGMLIDPAFLLSHVVEIALLVSAILVGKFLICAVTIKLFGYSARHAVRAGLLLAQIGEFSFVLASEGLHRGAIDETLYRLVLSGALVTLVLNSLLVSNLNKVTAPLSRFLGARSAAAGETGIDEDEDRAPREDTSVPVPRLMKGHVIVCGYGRVGQEMAMALMGRTIPIVAVDFSSGRMEKARADGVPTIMGDATNINTLERAGIEGARMLAVALPDLPTAERVVRLGRECSPKLEIVARTALARSIPNLKAAGATDVIQPEFEAGLEMVRQALSLYGVAPLEAQSIVGRRRRAHYIGLGASDPAPSEL